MLNVARVTGRSVAAGGQPAGRLNDPCGLRGCRCVRRRWRTSRRRWRWRLSGGCRPCSSAAASREALLPRGGSAPRFRSSGFEVGGNGGMGWGWGRDWCTCVVCFLLFGSLGVVARSLSEQKREERSVCVLDVPGRGAHGVPLEAFLHPTPARVCVECGSPLSPQWQGESACGFPLSAAGPRCARTALFSCTRRPQPPSAARGSLLSFLVDDPSARGGLCGCWPVFSSPLGAAAVALAWPSPFLSRRHRLSLAGQGCGRRRTTGPCGACSCMPVLRPRLMLSIVAVSGWVAAGHPASNRLRAHYRHCSSPPSNALLLLSRALLLAATSAAPVVI